MGRLLLIAFRNLFAHKRRTVLLATAIAGVTILLVLLTSVSNGIRSTMLRAATTLSTGHVNVGGFFKVTSGQSAPVVTDYLKITAELKTLVPEANAIVDRLRGWGKVISATGSIQVGISGIDIATEPLIPQVVKVVAGDLAGLRRPRTMLIFEKQAKRLEVNVGDRVTISAPTVRGVNNAIDVEIVAIGKDIGMLSSFSLFTPKQTVRDLYLMTKSTTGAIHIYLKDHRTAGLVAEGLRKQLKERGHRMLEPLAQPFWAKFPIVNREAWTGQKLDVTSWKEELAFLTWVLTAFDVLTVVVVGILLVIVVVGVMNVFWIVIRERTKEIGTLRAIGMSRRYVLLLFLAEAALLSLLSTTLGAGLGALSAALLDRAAIGLSEGFAVLLMSDTLRLVVDSASVIKALITISAITTLFSLWPAYLAARLRPVTAIHHVG